MVGDVRQPEQRKTLVNWRIVVAISSAARAVIELIELLDKFGIFR